MQKTQALDCSEEELSRLFAIAVWDNSDLLQVEKHLLNE